MRGLELFYGKARPDFNAYADVVPRALSRLQVFDRYTIFRLRTGRSPRAARNSHDGITGAGRIVSRTYYSWEHEGIPTILVLKSVKIGDVYVYGLPRLDVCDLLFKDVRPMLHEKACPVALCASL